MPKTKKVTLIIEEEDGRGFEYVIPLGQVSLDIYPEYDEPEISSDSYFDVLLTYTEHWKLDLHIDMLPAEDTNIIWSVKELEESDEHQD